MEDKPMEMLARSYKTKKSKSLVIEGRPERDTVINEEDIMNLKIALATARSFEEFLSLV